MKIENAQYVLIDGTTKKSCINCIIDGLKMSVPLDTANRHYAEILKQVAEKKLTIKKAD